MSLELFSSKKKIIGFVSVLILVIGIIVALIILRIKYYKSDSNTDPNNKIA